jgi:hypothetical protein
MADRFRQRTEADLTAALNFLERVEYHSSFKDKQHLTGNVLSILRVRLRSGQITSELATSFFQIFNDHVVAEDFGYPVEIEDFINGDF